MNLKTSQIVSLVKMTVKEGVMVGKGGGLDSLIK